ncbi:hypothetical protein GOB93_10635 [Acetobacter musti]|uniref:Uncharacterized protein n=1 Tax=Acetobacter musti TaxID=864732 RepID=A0ABX0JPT0_9PROT|nr:hypothetical protein [Acetobacter musti]NHN85094.1 hypothetical protein [Acetobacter musti]
MLVNTISFSAFDLALINSLRGQNVSHIRVLDGLFLDIHCSNNTVVGFMPDETEILHPREEFWGDIKHPRIINRPFCDEDSLKNTIHEIGTLPAFGDVRSIWGLRTAVSVYEFQPPHSEYDPAAGFLRDAMPPEIQKLPVREFRWDNFNPDLVPDSADYVIADIGIVLDVGGTAVNASTLENHWSITQEIPGISTLTEDAFKLRYKVYRVF